MLSSISTYESVQNFFVVFVLAPPTITISALAYEAIHNVFWNDKDRLAGGGE